jgi:hypothetical protein
MVSLVERMLELHCRLPAARLPAPGSFGRPAFLRGAPHRKRKCSEARCPCGVQVEAMDAQIDRLVYALYGLTEEEVRVVEGRA